jgi:invasion protein IalB
MIFRSFQAVLLFILLSGLFVIASESSEKQIETKRSGYWTYYCINFEKQRQCKIARKINIEEQNETFLIIYNVTKDISSKVKESLNITTPPAPRVNIKKRLKISFDNKTKFTRSFLKCESDSCLVMFGGGKMLKYSLKNFNKIKITFYSSEDEEPISLTLPIDGFTEALNNVNQQLESY